MADTPRTLTALQALLADNTTEAISAQDVRDFMVSAMGGYGGIYAAADASAQSAISTSFAKLAGWSDTITAASQCTPAHATDNITVSVAGFWIALGSLSFSGSVSTTFTVRVHVDSVDSGMGFVRKLGTGGDVGSGVLIAPISCPNGNEVIDVHIKADGSGKSLTVNQGSTLALIRLA